LKTKSNTLLTAGIALALLLSAGCASQGSPVSGGQSGAAAGTAPENKAAEEKTTIVVWGGVPEESGPGDVIRAFEALHPEIKVEYYRYVNDEQGNLKLDTALLADDDIDLYYSYSDSLAVTRIERGVAEDLTPWLEKAGFDMTENYGEGYATHNGKVYGLPDSLSNIVIYLNKDMFDEAGIPIPEEWTIEEYREIAAKLTGTRNGQHVFGGMMDWMDTASFLLHVPLLGPDSFYKEDGTSNFDHPIFRTSLEFLQNLMVKDKSHVSLIEYQTSQLTLYGEFLNGRTAMMSAGLSLSRYIKDRNTYPHDFVTAFAPFPLVEAGKPNYGWKGLSNVIMMNKNSRNKEAAFQFLLFAGTEGQIYYAKAGKLPSWKKIDKDKVMAEILGPDAEEIFDLESFERVVLNPKSKFFFNTKFTAYPQIIKIWQEEVEKVLGGQQDIDRALLQAKERADQVIRAASQ